MPAAVLSAFLLFFVFEGFLHLYCSNDGRIVIMVKS